MQFILQIFSFAKNKKYFNQKKKKISFTLVVISEKGETISSKEFVKLIDRLV